MLLPPAPPAIANGVRPHLPRQLLPGGRVEPDPVSALMSTLLARLRSLVGDDGEAHQDEERSAQKQGPDERNGRGLVAAPSAELAQPRELVREPLRGAAARGGGGGGAAPRWPPDRRRAR